MDKFKKIMFDNSVTILFVLLCIVAIWLSGQAPAFILGELVIRISRNLFLILALIIPVLAGMGLNFGIVIGAMAGQMAIIAVTHYGIGGLPGFLLCILLSTPLSIVFGWMTGKLLNKTKGQEMIASMILGFFANGIYQLIFLFLIGTLIPMKNPVMVLAGGVGIKNTVDLTGGIKYALDGIYNIDLYKTIVIASIATIIYCVYKFIVTLKTKQKKDITSIVFLVLTIAVVVFSTVSPKFNMMLRFVDVPIITLVIIFALAVFNTFITKTKLGQDFRAVGHDMHIAKAAGINVDKTRVIAIVLSTVLAGWGQIIFLQNIGTLNTYGSHEQVGMFAIAALLIGGASVTKANNKQALLGVILFHTLFIVSPMAGKNLFDNAQIGEYFRVFIAYGVIAVSLGLHAWKKSAENKRKVV